jgi:hypothetical protein
MRVKGHCPAWKGGILMSVNRTRAMAALLDIITGKNSCKDALNYVVQKNRELSGVNGLSSLVEYYQNLFEKEENINYYNPDDYQNAKRKFVKFMVNTRVTI